MKSRARGWREFDEAPEPAKPRRVRRSGGARSPAVAFLRPRVHACSATVEAGRVNHEPREASIRPRQVAPYASLAEPHRDISAVIPHVGHDVLDLDPHSSPADPPPPRASRRSSSCHHGPLPAASPPGPLRYRGPRRARPCTPGATAVLHRDPRVRILRMRHTRFEVFIPSAFGLGAACPSSPELTSRAGSGGSVPRLLARLP